MPYHLKSVPEASTQLAILKTGEADIVYYAQVGPTLNEMKSDPNIKLVTTSSFSGYYATFTHLMRKDKPETVFRDKRVRHALSYGVDRQLIVDKVFFGFGKPTYTCCIPPDTPQWIPSASISYDVEKARSLLAEAGYPNGLEIKALCTTREKLLTEAVTSMWTKIGVKSKIEVMETGASASAFRKRTLPYSVRFSRQRISPIGMISYFQNNQTYTNMVDDELHRLTREMMKFPVGPDMFAFIKNNMTQFVHDLTPCLPFVAPHLVHGVRKELKTDEWEAWGTRRWSYGPCAEYLVPRR